MAKHAHPEAWWWLKADGCDLVSGLKESVKLEWSGDVDLNNGKLQELHSEYKSSLEFVEAVGVGRKRDQRVLLADLHKLQNLEGYLTFLSSGKTYIYILHSNVTSDLHACSLKQFNMHSSQGCILCLLGKD